MKSLSPCGQCCFYREVLLDSQRMRRLCMLTGEKNPQLMQHHCHFIPGLWRDIDEILGLPKAGNFGNTDLPNTVKPDSGVSKQHGKITIQTKFAIDDYTVLPIYHINERRFCTSDDPRGLSHRSMGERVKSPSCI